MVNVIKNKMENAKDMAMNAGVPEGGAERVSNGAEEGRTERSYTGESDAIVQLTAAASSVLEQEPRAPRNTLGPSTLEPFVVAGETVSNETRSLSITTGARKAKSESRIAVAESSGAK